MAFKVNYGQQRNDRRRAQESRKLERLKRREDASLRRREQREGEPPLDDPTPAEQDEPSKS
jgi:hypothetical protein